MYKYYTCTKVLIHYVPYKASSEENFQRQQINTNRKFIVQWIILHTPWGACTSAHPILEMTAVNKDS